MVEQVVITWTPIIVSICALGFSILRSSKSDKQVDSKELEERVKEMARINFKLDEINRAVGELKHEMSTFRIDEKNIEARLATVEASLKSLHKRVDTTESRLNFEDKE